VEGILVGQHNIPIDQNILKEAVRLGYDSEYTRECLLTNKHNAATTTYYLLLKQRH
jgi:5'-AMP-activated protein kinase catalytic alpha subunit